ncbi:TonB-dependent siderophore receptor [Dysgonomonas sp. 511]|uniref:TonB-dependent receptor plug domain-containing protein n=1 Tax=Dysgonomonas sp. 511 TaxID=2302930 RepID=UPI0013D81337|nr:TonB-dependent receptor [Dysgonomonas sp. 511]NDV78256.1 TonB-dependent receptor [Dysgonomonas sp. 511]
MRILIAITFISLFVRGSYAQTNDSIKAHRLGEVEISAANKPSEALSATPLQVITSEELLKQGIQSVSDAVRRFNGIVLKDYGGVGGLKTIAIRGMGAEHTAVSYDGVTISNVQSGQVDVGRFSLDNISAVSLNIGQSDEMLQTARALASGGVLNLQTSAPRFRNKSYRIHSKITAGSFGLFNPMVDYAQKIGKSSSLSANASWQRADGNYSLSEDIDKLIPERKRKNSDVDIFRSEVNLYTDMGNAGLLKAKVYYFDSERGLPGAVILGNDYSVERLWDKNAFAQISYDKKFGSGFHLKSNAKYDYVYTRYRDDNVTNKYKEQEAYLSNSLQFDANRHFSFSLAEDLFFNKLDNKIQQFGDNLPYPKRYASLSAFTARYNNSFLTITAGALATYISEEVKNNYGDNKYKKISPLLSISYKPFAATNLRLRASYKHIYRVPTFTELYYSSVHKVLDPESAKQLNVGLTWVGAITNTPVDYLNFSVDGYRNKVDDKIVIIPKTFLATTMNVGNADIKGIDARLSANATINKKFGLNMSLSYSFMQAQDVTDKETERYKHQLPYTPKHSGAATLTFVNPWVEFSYSVVAASERYSLLINEADSKVDRYTDHSISLYREFKVKQSQIYLQGNVLNLWNKYYDIIAYYPMPGRSFKVTLGARF